MTLTTSQILDGALAWGQARLGSKEYTTLCYLFVEDCYEIGNGIILDGKGSTAKEAAEAYGCLDGEPEKGAYVFFDCSGPIKGEILNWGHIGIAKGDGRVIHAWDQVRIDTIAEIEKLAPPPGWTAPVYTGWASVSLILEGVLPSLSE